jgi:hypothetical protein
LLTLYSPELSRSFWSGDTTAEERSVAAVPCPKDACGEVMETMTRRAAARVVRMAMNRCQLPRESGVPESERLREVP